MERKSGDEREKVCFKVRERWVWLKREKQRKGQR